jgi:hypothetical protein
VKSSITAPRTTQFVIHLATYRSNKDAQAHCRWGNEAHRKLDLARIPYRCCRHPTTHSPTGGDWRASTRIQRQLRPALRGKPVAGHYGSGNESNYSLFEVGPMRFLVSSPDTARARSRCAGREVIGRAPPTGAVIIPSHCIQTHGGGFASQLPQRPTT